MVKIALVHPPASSGRRFQLDTYCSQPQKGPFRWHPLDFAAIAGSWHHEADIRIFDWGLGKPQDGIARLHGYDLIIGLIGAYGWSDHLQFWSKVARTNSASIYLSGDIARHEPVRVFSALPDIRGILPEFSSVPPLEAVLSEHIKHPALWRPDQAAYILPKVAKGFKVGIQPYELYQHEIYSLPFFQTRPWASTWTQTGCPFVCDYCIVGTYKWSPRDLDEFAHEVRVLRKHHVRHVYVRDATFNASLSHAEHCIEILRQSDMTWNTFARVEGAGSLAPKMAAAGCKVLQFGLDSPDHIALNEHQKYIRTDDIRAEIKAVQKAGISTVGHFVLGLGSNDSPFAIARYANRLGLDWITISPLMIRPGTSYWTDTVADNMDSLYDASPNRSLTAAQIWFYLRSPTFKTLLGSYGRSWIRQRQFLA